MMKLELIILSQIAFMDITSSAFTHFDAVGGYTFRVTVRSNNKQEGKEEAVRHAAVTRCRLESQTCCCCQRFSQYQRKTTPL